MDATNIAMDIPEYAKDLRLDLGSASTPAPQPCELTISSCAPRAARNSMIGIAPPRYTAPCSAGSPFALMSVTAPSCPPPS